MDSTVIVTLIIAILGSGGLWGFLQWVLDVKIKKRTQTLAEINEKLSSVPTSSDIQQLSQNLKNVWAEIETTKNVSLSLARDKLNSRCNKYLDLGYIPIDDYVAFKSIGDNYVKAGGNSEVKAKYELVMSTLEPHAKQ